MTKMHHITVDAARDTGEWIDGTISYAGEVESADFYKLSDTDEHHFDTHHMTDDIRRVVEPHLGDPDGEDKDNHEFDDVAVTVTHVE